MKETGKPLAIERRSQDVHATVKRVLTEFVEKFSDTILKIKFGGIYTAKSVNGLTRIRPVGEYPMHRWDKPENTIASKAIYYTLGELIDVFQKAYAPERFESIRFEVIPGPSFSSTNKTVRFYLEMSEHNYVYFCDMEDE